MLSGIVQLTPAVFVEHGKTTELAPSVQAIGTRAAPVKKFRRS
jgi:hypothetical protein